ncbi:hypothetical protein C8F04DRAFT_1259850 [Mycena alexandri]|uniref:Uncharacterized protein n=1 Tax=Mycena alexandri TaxID=1745969 RepID=A0AAD6SVM8_9AGAR|nr:hypothetical protein C8F04DRAFT_1259850 [Mycena alexandri]
MSFTTFAFNSPTILNSTFTPDDDDDVEYTTSTTVNGVKKRSSRQITYLQGAPETANSVIDWKRNTFEISGMKRHMSDLRTKRSTFSSTRYWTWFDAEEYKVKYEAELDKTWTVFSYDGSVLATFTAAVQRLFNSNSMPVLSLSEGIVDEDERRFIILVLLYSETKRLESLRERPLAVFGDFLGNLS